jgi:hypothetical protein
MTRAVERRRALDLALRDLARLEGHVRASPSLSAADRQGGGMALAIAGARRATEEAAARARALADAALLQLTTNCPLALLVFPSLDRRKNPGGPWTVQAFRQAWKRELAVRRSPASRPICAGTRTQRCSEGSSPTKSCHASSGTPHPTCFVRRTRTSTKSRWHA